MERGPRGSLWAELSGENIPLAVREVEAVLSLLLEKDAGVTPLAGRPQVYEIPYVDAVALAHRAGLLRRVLAPVAEGSLRELQDQFRAWGAGGGSLALRWSAEVAEPGSSGAPRIVRSLGEAFVHGGGTIRLDDPDHHFEIWRCPNGPPGRYWVLQRVAHADRSLFQRHRSSHLPFSRPVTLPPWLARVLVNLAQVRPGGKILDPFCGTGAIPLQAALLGYEVWASDADPRMIRGTLRNLQVHGCAPRAALSLDISDLVSRGGDVPKQDAIVTDPPYGRASRLVGRSRIDLLDSLAAVADKLVIPGGRIVLMGPEREQAGFPRKGWVRQGEPIPHRVHRSLTRWVSVFRRVP
jgi:tRNA (guanine10-N2)-dimethyltransferase